MNMEIMQHTTTVLLCGLEPTWMQQNRPDSSRNFTEDTYTTFTSEFDKLLQTEGLYMEIHLLNPDSRDNVNELKRKIRDGSGPEGGNKSWDGVLLDWALRTDLELTTLFEELMNYVHETLPGTKILFSSSDNDWTATLKRNLNIGHERVPLTKTALEAMHAAATR